MSEKKRCFIIGDNQIEENVCGGDVAEVLKYIEMYLWDCKDGDTVSFEIERKDMTQEEIDAIPDL